MKLTYAFYLQAAALLIASTLWILAPALFHQSMGMETSDPVWLLFGRNTGMLLFALCLVALFSARAADSPLRRQIRLSFFVLQLLSLGTLWSSGSRRA